ncbi:MAG: hypothetical protein V7727_08305 [Sneathiella sp.]
MGTKWFNTQEPEIEDLLSDPILLAVLARDRITVEDLQDVITSYKKTNPGDKISFTSGD